MNVPRLRFQGFKGDWLESRINQITSYVDYRGKTPTKVESGVFLVTAKNVRMGYIDYENSKEFIAKDDYDNVMSRGKPVVGDVLITTEAPMGNIASVDRDDIALAQRVIKLRGIEAILQNEFLKYRLQSKQFQEKLTALSSGGTVKGIKGSVLHKIQVLIPAIGEQQKIASFLSAIDQKIFLLTKNHELLLQYKKGVMQKIFNQEIRFKDKAGEGFPEWQSLTFDDVCIVNMGQSPESSSYNEDSIGIPLIQGNADICNRLTVPRIWTSQPTKTCDFGDLILTVRAPVGAVSKSTTRACIGRGVCSMSPKENTSRDFLYQLLFWFESFKWKSIEQGSTFTAISGGDIRSLKVEFPCFEEQVEIAKFLDSLDLKINSVKSKLELTKQYKQGLLQQMFI